MKWLRYSPGSLVHIIGLCDYCLRRKVLLGVCTGFSFERTVLHVFSSTCPAAAVLSRYARYSLLESTVYTPLCTSHVQVYRAFQGEHTLDPNTDPKEQEYCAPQGVPHRPAEERCDTRHYLGNILHIFIFIRILYFSRGLIILRYFLHFQPRIILRLFLQP